MKKILIILLYIVVMSCFSFTSSIPKYTGWVNDFSGVISSEYRFKLNSVITELEQKTSSELAVVTLKSLEGEDIDSYANSLFSEWKIGKKGKDNGVLVLIAVSERKWRIEVGYGLEQILPDGLCGLVADKYMIPDFKSGEYGKGLYNGVLALSAIIAKSYNAVITGTENMDLEDINRTSKPSIFKTIISLLFMILMIRLFIRHPFLFLLLMSGGRGGRGGFRGGSRGFGGFGGGFSGGGGASGGW